MASKEMSFELGFEKKNEYEFPKVGREEYSKLSKAAGF